MERNMSVGADSIDWADPAFTSTDFPESMMGESPWGNSALNDFTNLADYSDSPGALGLRTPSKSGPASAGSAPGQRHPPTLPHDSSMSAESSSADSGSDSSGGRKRKVASQSPASNQGMSNVAAIKEESAMNAPNYQNVAPFQQTFTPTMPRLAVDQNMADSEGMFDFNSAASSPNLPRDFNQQLSLEAKKNILSANAAPSFAQGSPVQTINPGMFTLGGSSRDQSPATNTAMFNTASPNAIFSTPSSDSNEQFNANQTWATGMTPNPSWPADFTNQFASPSGLNFTPSPVPNGGTPSVASRGTASNSLRAPLHIAPISAKSRVETQINVVMTLEKPPPGIEHLHLPLHTIAKSKLLAKEDYDMSKVLELHTMLVCSSAMHNPALREKALQRAAAQNNDEIQKRAEDERDSGEEEKNNMKNVEESEKPANGGEVRICNNCIQRERKRAGRKKLKKEEEQQHWERYETERVVVFNSSEFLPFKPAEPRDQASKDGNLAIDEPYEPPPGAISASAAMRIACYCRHQSEKEGFQVIFTMKDQKGNVVAQEMSDSILITDDHKTHPPTLTPVSNEMLFQSVPLTTNGLPTSYSMMDLSSHAQPFTSSRSAGNLQALAYNPHLQFNPHSHIHQLPNTGFASSATSATMTPTNLSRPGSPSSAGQAGPNKKRKSASFHKRVPSGLQMTPRVDTTAQQQQQQQQQQQSQPPSATLSSGISMANFSPTRGAFGGQADSSYMTIPTNNGPAQYFGSGPPTPANDNAQFHFGGPGGAGGQPHQLDIARAQNAAYFSHPSSAVPSRSNSPVLQHSRPAMSAFPRVIQTPPNTMSRGQGTFGAQALAGAGSGDTDQATAPTITKITPTEGPVAGGTEVSIFGYNFTHATQVIFGDSLAPTTFYGAQSILAISPPGRRGAVRVKLVPSTATALGGSLQYPSATQSNSPVFTYTDTNPQMMEMALRFLSQQQTGDSGRWVQYTNEVANQFMQTSISPAGIQGGGFQEYGVSGMALPYEISDAAEAADAVEEILLKALDTADISSSPLQRSYDLRSASGGQTMLSLASAAGMHRLVAALLARGANPDVRDQGGYTPLMHAALHERARTFQLLLVRGADPCMRCLTGFSAIELVPTREGREGFQGILEGTLRSRCEVRYAGSLPVGVGERRRPGLSRFGSGTSTKVSWDISSASFYDSDVEDASEHSPPTSRRPSAHAPAPPMPIPIPQEAHVPPPVPTTPPHPHPTSLAAMLAWRDALAAQIQQFQHNVHSSITTTATAFQLPSLPPLPDYQDIAMVRRLSSLVPVRSLSFTSSAREQREDGGEVANPSSSSSSRFWDLFSLPSSASLSSSGAPPPAYSELFPDVGAAGANGKAGVGSAALDADAKAIALVDALADGKCGVLFDEPVELTDFDRAGAVVEKQKEKTAPCAPAASAAAGGATMSFASWMWMTLLIVSTSIALQLLVLPRIQGPISSMTAAAFSTKGGVWEFRPGGVGVRDDGGGAQLHHQRAAPPVMFEALRGC